MGRQLHGLVYEFGKRLVFTSQTYACHRTQLEQRAAHADFTYFGLPSNATEKDLQLAYRRMAKKMHPDKNGGTETAKQRFQEMKEKYENLLQRYRPQKPEGGDSADESSKEPESDKGERPVDKEESEPKEEPEEEPKEDDAAED